MASPPGTGLVPLRPPQLEPDGTERVDSFAPVVGPVPGPHRLDPGSPADVGIGKGDHTLSSVFWLFWGPCHRVVLGTGLCHAGWRVGGGRAEL